MKRRSFLAAAVGAISSLFFSGKVIAKQRIYDCRKEWWWPREYVCLDAKTGEKIPGLPFYYDPNTHLLGKYKLDLDYIWETRECFVGYKKDFRRIT